MAEATRRTSRRWPLYSSGVATVCLYSIVLYSANVCIILHGNINIMHTVYTVCTVYVHIRIIIYNVHIIDILLYKYRCQYMHSLEVIWAHVAGSCFCVWYGLSAGLTSVCLCSYCAVRQPSRYPRYSAECTRKRFHTRTGRRVCIHHHRLAYTVSIYIYVVLYWNCLYAANVYYMIPAQ